MKFKGRRNILLPIIMILSLLVFSSCTTSTGATSTATETQLPASTETTSTVTEQPTVTQSTSTTLPASSTTATTAPPVTTTSITASPSPSTTTTENAPKQVSLLYFHPTWRCVTCKYFEDRIRDVLATYFQKEIDSGRITLTLYDYLDKANTELVKKYQIVGSQLIILTTVDGKENARSVWEIYDWGTGNEKAFNEGLKAIIEESLAGGK